MNVLEVAQAHGIPTDGQGALLWEPHFEDPEATETSNVEAIEGPAVRVDVSSPGPPKSRWADSRLFRCASRQELELLVGFFRSRVGMVRPFWLPSWLSDLRLARAIAPEDRNTIDIQDEGFEFVFEAGRYGLMVVDARDRQHLWRLESYDPVRGRLTVQGQIDERIGLREARLVSLVRHCRFATRSLDVRYETTSVADIAVPFIEVFGEAD